MTPSDTPPVLGRYQRAVRAPRGLRKVMKLGEIERAVTSVDEWRLATARIEAAETALVRDLRGRGASWDAIGWLLGVSGSAVRQRFGDDAAVSAPWADPAPPSAADPHV